MNARHCLISGSVQGVGYRAWAADEAEKRGLSGWVRNLKSGDVEAVFSGQDAVVEEMLAALWTGPAGASVGAVETRDAAGEVGDGFEIRATA